MRGQALSSPAAPPVLPVNGEDKWKRPSLFFFLTAIFLTVFAGQALAAQPPAPALTTPGQAKVTLEELLVEAKANNPELLGAREMAKARSWRARAEGVLDDPTLKIEMEDLSKNKPQNNGPGNSMLTRYTVSQMFPFYGKRSLREKIALKEALAAEAELRKKELDVAASVKEAFYEYARLVGAVEITNELRDLFSYMSSITGVMYSTGQAAQQDFVKVQVETTMLENERIMLEAEKEAAQARLNSILSRPQGSVLGPPEPVADGRAELDAEALIKRAEEISPAIKAMKHELEATELSAELAGRNYYPDVMVGVAPVQRDGRFDAYDLMFQVNIPLWRGKYDSQAKEAVASAGGARFRLMAERNNKSFEIKEAVLKVEAAWRIKTLYETSLLPQTELSFESALKNYQSGKVGLLTLLETERDLKRTRIERLNSLMDYKKKIAQLERAVGEDILTVKNGAKPAVFIQPEKGLKK